MTPGRLRGKVVAERVSWIRRMLDGMKALPRERYEDFAADQRTVAAAESYLRRGLEALLDLGRHILAKGFGRGVTEYKEIPAVLAERGVLGREAGDLLREMAGYRNRLVHFYDEVSGRELYEICTKSARRGSETSNEFSPNWSPGSTLILISSIVPEQAAG